MSYLKVPHPGASPFEPAGTTIRCAGHQLHPWAQMKSDGLGLAPVPICEICGKNHRSYSGAAALRSVVGKKMSFRNRDNHEASKFP